MGCGRCGRCEDEPSGDGAVEATLADGLPHAWCDRRAEACLADEVLPEGAGAPQRACPSSGSLMACGTPLNEDLGRIPDSHEEVSVHGSQGIRLQGRGPGAEEFRIAETVLSQHSECEVAREEAMVE